MLQQDTAKDYVIATGEQYTVRQFIEWAAETLGITLRWDGAGVEEVGIVDTVDADRAPALKSGDVIVRIDPRYFRPAEVESLLGDPSLAKADLGWEPTVGVRELVAEMAQSDYDDARRISLLRDHGFHVPVDLES